MTKVFTRWLPCATFLTWSAILLFFYLSGRVAAYLHPTFRPFVLATGIAMLGVAVCFLFLPGVANCCNDAQCGHPLGRRTVGRVLTFAVLLLPVALAVLASPNQFGESTILNRGVITDAQSLAARTAPKAPATQPISSDAAEPPLPTKDGSQPAQAQQQQNSADAASDATDSVPRDKDGNIQISVIDLLYAAQDPSLRADFENKSVEMVGQFMPDNVRNANGKRFKVMRMFMVCCAADAKPVATLVEYPQKLDFPELSWVKVVGKATFPLESGRTIAVLKAASVTQSDPPDETMLY